MIGGGGIAKVPNCAVDRVDTLKNGCQPSITAFDGAITVDDTSDTDCRPRLYSC